MCLLIQSVNTNLVTRVCITLVRHCPFRWTRVTRTLETRLPGHKLYEDYRNDNTKISDSIFKEKKRSNTCTPCYFGIPLSSRTLYIKYRGWSFLLVMVKIFTKTIFIFCALRQNTILRTPPHKFFICTFQFLLSAPFLLVSLF